MTPWYFVSRIGMATLCEDKSAAEKEALEADKEWPHHAPHVAMQLVDAAHLEAERTARQAAQLRIEDLQAHLVRADAERCMAVAAEREACEERVVSLFEVLETPYLPDITRAIRARGTP